MVGALGGTQYGAARRAAGVPAKAAVGSAGSMSFSTWNASDKNANAGVTPFKDLLNQTVATNYAAVRGTLSRSIGKYYFEATIGSVSNNAGVSVGVGTSTATLSGYVGSDNKSVGYKSSNVFFIGNSQVSFAPTMVSGMVVGFAVDVSSGLIYVSMNGVYNSPMDPVNGLNGVSIGTGKTLFPMANVYDLTDAVLLNTGGMPSIYGPPSGYSFWG